MSAAIGYLTATSLGDGVRYAGTMLQLLGLLAVAYGLHQMRRRFGRPTLVAIIRDWVARLARAFRRPEPVTLRGSAIASAATVSAELRVRRGVPPGASIEQRVAALQENFDLLQSELDSKLLEVKKRLAELDQSVRQEERERSIGDSKTLKQLEEVAVGGLKLEAVGVIWLALGVLGTSIPVELAAMLTRLLS